MTKRVPSILSTLTKSCAWKIGLVLAVVVVSCHVALLDREAVQMTLAPDEHNYMSNLAGIMQPQQDGAVSLMTTTNEPLQCRVGISPWKALTPDDWNAYFREFITIWKQRPVFDNQGGGGAFHYFALFTIIRIIRPTAIVESGAWRGVGTWFLRQIAGPDVKIIVISPKHPDSYVDNHGDKSLYLTQGTFIDFANTTRTQWEDWVPSVENTLLFFDDHQAGMRRLDEARRLGFKHLVFDDNYPPGYGDNFALKQVCAGMDTWNLVGEIVATFQDNFGNKRHSLSASEYQQYQHNFHDWIAVYAEFPPLWAGPSRFAKWEISKHSRIVEKALFTPDQARALGLQDEDLPGWESEALKYTFIPYIEIK